MARNNKANKKQKNKKRSPVMLVLQLVMAGLAVLLVVSFISGQVQLARMQRESDELAGQVEQQQEKNEELQTLMDTGDEDDFVERIAREKLGYARPGERIYVDITGD
jgi:cell division protein DivIC